MSSYKKWLQENLEYIRTYVEQLYHEINLMEIMDEPVEVYRISLLLNEAAIKCYENTLLLLEDSNTSTYHLASCIHYLIFDEMRLTSYIMHDILKKYPEGNLYALLAEIRTAEINSTYNEEIEAKLNEVRSIAYQKLNRVLK